MRMHRPSVKAAIDQITRATLARRISATKARMALGLNRAAVAHENAIRGSAIWLVGGHVLHRVVLHRAQGRVVKAITRKKILQVTRKNVQAVRPISSVIHAEMLLPTQTTVVAQQ